ncbi:hypothetical protein Salat_0369900 [Sesamum alatum]|uniref:Uncharacterized protein n=1 Tax=Sesamum alatum TaxID=300844 RepID=A0AAE1Z130_9LAMI|nr:hypothetical protein Salat_0369900 [Sesamum alatum]
MLTVAEQELGPTHVSSLWKSKKKVVVKAKTTPTIEVKSAVRPNINLVGNETRKSSSWVNAAANATVAIKVAAIMQLLAVSFIQVSPFVNNDLCSMENNSLVSNPCLFLILRHEGSTTFSTSCSN